MERDPFVVFSDNVISRILEYLVSRDVLVHLLRVSRLWRSKCLRLTSTICVYNAIDIDQPVFVSLPTVRTLVCSIQKLDDLSHLVDCVLGRSQFLELSCLDMSGSQLFSLDHGRYLGTLIRHGPPLKEIRMNFNRSIPIGELFSSISTSCHVERLQLQWCNISSGLQSSERRSISNVNLPNLLCNKYFDYRCVQNLSFEIDATSQREGARSCRSSYHALRDDTVPRALASESSNYGSSIDGIPSSERCNSFVSSQTGTQRQCSYALQQSPSCPTEWTERQVECLPETRLQSCAPLEDGSYSSHSTFSQDVSLNLCERNTGSNWFSTESLTAGRTFTTDEEQSFSYPFERRLDCSFSGRAYDIFREENHSFSSPSPSLTHSSLTLGEPRVRSPNVVCSSFPVSMCSNQPSSVNPSSLFRTVFGSLDALVGSDHQTIQDRIEDFFHQSGFDDVTRKAECDQIRNVVTSIRDLMIALGEVWFILRGQNVGEESGMRGIIRYLSRTHISKLILRGNPLQQDSLNLLFFGCTLAPCHSLRELDLSNCGLSSDSVLILLNLGLGLPYLQRLDLSGNNLHEGCDFLYTQTFSSFHPPPLRYMGLQNCKLTNADVDGLVQIFPIAFPQIAVLDLDGNYFSSEAVCSFIHLLEQLQLSSLSLSFNSIPYFGCLRLMHSAKKCRLRELYLCENELSEHGKILLRREARRISIFNLLVVL